MMRTDKNEVKGPAVPVREPMRLCRVDDLGPGKGPDVVVTAALDGWDLVCAPIPAGHPAPPLR
jgi:hypothetical protein